MQTEKDQLTRAHQILAFVIGCSWRGKCYSQLMLPPLHMGGLLTVTAWYNEISLEAGLSHEL